MSVIDSVRGFLDSAAWPCAAVPPLVSAIVRADPGDFAVAEQMPFALEGAGEHLWLKIRKRGLNSEQVAIQLARAAGIKRRDVGYAGMKDRHAVTVQWFSLYLPGRNDPQWEQPGEGIELLESCRHTRKLKTGALAGNSFAIVLRDCQGNRADVQQRVEEIVAHGVPNYFGEQRFGHGGGNIPAARALFSGTLRPRDRKQAGIYLSAARSFIFNHVLAARVRAKTWDQALLGDALNLNGSRSFFVPEVIDEVVLQRLSEGDVHPTGPLWGRGELASRNPVRELERMAVSEHMDLAVGLEQAGLEQERRALRVVPKEFTLNWQDERTLALSFSLPPGSYATVVLRELAKLQNLSAVAGLEPT